MCKSMNLKFLQIYKSTGLLGYPSPTDVTSYSPEQGMWPCLCFQSHGAESGSSLKSFPYTDLYLYLYIILLQQWKGI